MCKMNQTKETFQLTRHVNVPPLCLSCLPISDSVSFDSDGISPTAAEDLGTRVSRLHATTGRDPIGTRRSSRRCGRLNSVFRTEPPEV